MPSTAESCSAWSTVCDELERAVASVRREPIDALVARFRRTSGRVFFAGQGRSGLVAEMAAMRFMQLGRQAHVVGEVTTPSLRAGDTLVVVSGSGRTPTSVEFARTARREGGIVVLLTTEVGGPIQDIADDVIAIDVPETAQFGNTLFEHVALLMLDSVVFALMTELDDAAAAMQRNHTNLE